MSGSGSSSDKLGVAGPEHGHGWSKVRVGEGRYKARWQVVNSVAGRRHSKEGATRRHPIVTLILSGMIDWRSTISLDHPLSFSLWSFLNYRDFLH